MNWVFNRLFLLLVLLLSTTTNISAALAEKTTYILAIDCSGSMVEEDFSPGINRWDFMLTTVAGFLDHLEDGTPLQLVLFAREPLKPIPYVLGENGVTAETIKRDIADYVSTASFKDFARGHSGYGAFNDYTQKQYFFQYTALYETSLQLFDLVEKIGKDDPSQSIDILFYADGMDDPSRSIDADGTESMSGYKDPRLRNTAKAEHANLVSSVFENLVKERGYKNTWLYFTWVVNQQQFQEVYRQALAGGDAVNRLDADTRKLLQNKPLIDTPDNHILYDLPYPRLSIGLFPREHELSNPHKRPSQEITVKLSYGKKTAKIIGGKNISLEVVGDAAKWLSLPDKDIAIRTGSIQIALEIKPQTLDPQKEYQAILKVSYPDPEELGKFKLIGPQELLLRFASLAPPKLEIISPRPGAIATTSSPIRFEARAVNADIEWHFGDGKVLRGERVQRHFKTKVGETQVKVIARDRDVPGNKSVGVIDYRVEQVELHFDPVGDVNARLEGKPLILNVTSSYPLDRYQWTINHSDPETYGAKISPITEDGKKTSLKMTPYAGRYEFRVSGYADDLPNLNVDAQPSPLRLTVLLQAQITWVKPYPGQRQEYQSRAESLDGVELRAEVFGDRYNKVEWEIRPEPNVGNLPEELTSGLESGKEGWRVARAMLPPVLESSGIKAVKIRARAFSNMPNMAPLETDFYTFEFMPPVREAEIVNPPTSKGLYFGGEAVEFKVQVTGPEPVAVIWTLLDPEGNTIAVAEESVKTEEGVSSARFIHQFTDPDFQRRGVSEYRVTLKVKFKDGTELPLRQPKVYRVSHPVHTYHLTRRDDNQDVRWDSVVSFQVNQEGLADVPASDIAKVEWQLSSEVGDILFNKTTGVSELSLELKSLGLDNPYGTFHLAARVQQRSGQVHELKPQAYHVSKHPPKLRLEVDGSEVAALNLTFDGKLTVTDNSSGDIASRKWVSWREDKQGQIIGKKREHLYVSGFPVESEPWGELEESSHFFLKLLVTDPSGIEYGQEKVLKITFTPPRPWWLILLTLFLTGLVHVIWGRRFFGNAVRHWAVRFSRELDDGRPDFSKSKTSLCNRWDRKRKQADLPMRRLFRHDDYWAKGSGRDSVLVIKGLRGANNNYEASIALRDHPTRLGIQAISRSPFADEFRIPHPENTEENIYLRVDKQRSKPCSKQTWQDRFGMSGALLVYGTLWIATAWYLTR